MPDAEPTDTSNQLELGLGRQYRLADIPTMSDEDRNSTGKTVVGANVSANGDTVARLPADKSLSSLDKPTLFVNRELSWLAFNRRVLLEAGNANNPLLERVKFLAIASTNLDEFFEIRVAGIMEMVDAGLLTTSHDGLSPPEELDLVRTAARVFASDMHEAWSKHLLPELVREGFLFPVIRDLTGNQKQWVDSWFQREVYPILTPLAIDPAHPFPVLLNKSLNIVLLLRDPHKTRRPHRMAVVQVPRTLPRILKLPEQDGNPAYVFTADLVQANLHTLFPGLEVMHTANFRVTRDSNLEVDEVQAEDLMSSIEKELLKRRRGEPVRLEIDSDAHPEVLERFQRAFQLEQDDIYFCDGPVNLGRIMELYSLIENPTLRDEPSKPRRQWQWRSGDEMFADLRDGDILLHHPYDSFATVEDFVRQAAKDPQVLAIKQTIYRAGDKNVMVDALIEAAQDRKQVTAIIELKARFDEAANIEWARRMERAGVHVVYGIVGMKTHAKCTLIVRREDDNSLQRYCHIGTGNYNPSTARLYTDVGFITARHDVGEEVAETFNMITGFTRAPQMEHLLIAPFNLRDQVVERIQKEIANKKRGKPAIIKAKLNNLADPSIILALYEASRAGVKVELCVRSVCCLRPGVKGLSDNITVTAIIDRFLEHSRVYYFENNGDPEVFLSSADWMIRNLDRRVEVAAPILDPDLKQRVIEEVLNMSLYDNVKAHKILPDGTSERLASGNAQPLRSQAALLELTMSKSETAGDAADAKRTKKRPKKSKRNRRAT